jgi:hypothetical protein
MKLSALLLTIVIALGLGTPLEARAKHKTPKPPKSPKHATLYKEGSKRKTKPSKVKPMKFRKPKHSGKINRVKPAKVHKAKTPKSV